MRPPGLLLGALFILAAYQHAEGQEVAYPRVYLRTRVIDTRQEALRQQRRRLLGNTSVPAPSVPHPHHTDSQRWGTLRGAHQWLLSHSPGLAQEQQAALVAHIEAAGCHVAHYLPDHTLLVVGPAAAAQAVEQHEHVLWLGPHEGQDKKAPEWRRLLQQLEQLRPALDQLAALARRGANATAAATEAATVLRAALPAASEWDAAAGELMVGAVVAFPGLAGSSQRRVAEQQQAEHQQRSRRVALEREQRDSGAAAAADWGEPLWRLFGARVWRASADNALVLAPAGQLPEVLGWLAARPATHWLAPAPKLRFNNIRASTISQSARATSSGSSGIDASYHPIWAAGLTGKGHVVGCGDSGIDRFHCFLSDPAFHSAEAWQAAVSLQDGVRTFDSTEHRKIRYHRAYGDTEDSNGHGTHVVGTLVGMPYGSSLGAEAPNGYIGMAPDAKIAFIDLADSSSDRILTPSDLIGGYFRYTSAVGACIHSDSWGTNEINYDYLAQQVDQYSWDNPEFLPVLPAGNDGQRATVGMRKSGESTVTSPANAKNCLSVGATQTAGEKMDTTAVSYSVWDATVTEGQYVAVFRVMQADFGGSVLALTGGTQYPVAIASPLDACSPLQNGSGGVGLAGAVVLIQRGNCYFSKKALAAQDAGAAAVLLFDNVLGAYFVARDDSASPVRIPVTAVTRRIGQQMTSAVAAGKALTIAFEASAIPSNSFENLASYSSQGPTLDYRVKPDIVAPGTVTSAQVGHGSSQDCGLITMAGTSMATPVTAGSALLVRQYFTDGFYPSGSKNPSDAFLPTSALLKAVLMGGAATLDGFEADTGLPLDPPPSFRQGFGRVFLGNSLYLAGTAGSKPLQLVDKVSIGQDQTHLYCLHSNGGPLSITLVWTDYPASLISRKALVHDLDLTVRAAGLNGVPLLGNGGSVSDPTTPDRSNTMRENNVEQVAWTSLPPGLVSIAVSGALVAEAVGAPTYALVVTGDFNGTLTRPGGSNDAAQCTVLVAVITSGPSGITSTSPVQFQFEAGSGSGINFQCRLADSSGNVTSNSHHAWRTCITPALYTSLPDGTYQFSVRADGEDIATNQNFVLDTTPPTVALAPGSLQSGATTSAATANITWEGSDATGVTYTCTLEARDTVPMQPQVYSGTSKMRMEQVSVGQSYNCTSPQVLHWLLPGAWSLSVVGQDLANNTAAPLVVQWSVAYDSSAGLYTRFLSGPFGLQSKANLTFTFTDLDSSGQAAQAFSQHQCWLEAVGGVASLNSTYVNCASPFALPADTEDGQYCFHARVAGTTGAAGTEAVCTFQLDSIPPAIGITDPPDALLAANATSASFNSSKEGARYYCGLAWSEATNAAPATPDASTYYPCSSPIALTNLTDGNYVFGVYAVDMVGNKGQPATAAFVVDVTPPTFTAISVPGATANPDVTVTFTAYDSGSGINNVTCRFRALSLANGSSTSAGEDEWQRCTSPQKYSGLQEGRYGLTLRASDKVGLSTQTDEMEVYVDFTPPTVSTESFPPLGEPVASTVTFHLAELTAAPEGSYSNVSTYQTLVETVPDQATYSSLELVIQRGETTGHNSDSVNRSTNQSAADSGHPGQRHRRRALLADNSAGAGETVLPASSVGNWTNCTATCTYEGLGSGLYSIRVRAIDAAGNMGNATDKYPFQVDASIGSTSFPVWAIVACAVGGLAVASTLGFFLWRCCCAAPQRSGAGGGTPAGAMHSPSPSNQYIYSPGTQAYPSYTNVYSQNGYPATAPANGGGGAWGYQAPASYPTNGQYTNGHANGYTDGYAGGRAALAPGTAESAGITPDMDPIQAQYLALAAAASQRASTARQPSRSHAHCHHAAPAPTPLAAAGNADEEWQMRLAIDASLQEQRAWARQQAEDAELRSAVEASLREQHSQTADHERQEGELGQV